MRIRIITSTLLLITAILGQAQNFEGTISGIKMNEKSYSDIVGQHFELKKSDNGKGTIEGIVAQIGKMPGTLHFAIPVTIGTDGKLATTKETEAGYMKMSFGPTKSLDTKSFKGSVTDGKLHFELRVTSSMLGFTIADATMVFDGTK